MSAAESRLARWRRVSDALEERQRARDRRELALLTIATVFIIGNAIAYSLVSDGAISWAHLLAPLLWLGAVFAAALVIGRLKPRRDPFLLPTFALLAGWGLLLQDRLAPNFLGRQTMWFLLATLAAVAVAVLPRSLQALMRYRYVLLFGGLAALALTFLFGANPSGAGAALWLPIPAPFLGTIYLQPSEPLKLLLIIFLASFFTEREPLYHYRRRSTEELTSGPSRRFSTALRRQAPFLGPLLIMWGFCLLLLVWQQDLGAATLFFVIFIALLYLSTGNLGYVGAGLVLLFLAAILAYFIFDGVVASRVLSWLNPWPNVSDRAYQIAQALYAQAAGGILGRGIGQGFPDYIPVVHSDFALAAIAEEWGLVGSLAVIACYALLAQRGLRTALLSIRGSRPKFFHAYLAAGITVLFSTQVLLIGGGVTKLLPLTGITLPLVSYGGSSLVVSGLMLGLLLFLSADADQSTIARAFDVPLAGRIESVCMLFLLGFGLVALALAYWSTWRSETLLARSDNPRLLEADFRVQRGQILDHEGAILAESTGASNRLTRLYPRPHSQAVLGYYSLRYGASGIEEAYDPFLRGANDDYWATARQRLLNLSTTGGDVWLTLDAGLQRLADTQMLGNTGAVVLLEVVSTEESDRADVRVMVSQPSYDPNLLDDRFEELASDDPGPLINRASQGRYQPGLTLQPLLLMAAIDEGLLRLDEQVSQPDRPLPVDGQLRRCESRPSATGTRSYTWPDILAMRCPAPVATLGARLGVTTLDRIWREFGLTTVPELPIDTGPATESAIDDAALSAIGQDTLTVSPLQLALAYSTLATSGRQAVASLVEGTVDRDGTWIPAPTETVDVPVAVSPNAAVTVRAAMPSYGDALETAVTVISGPDGEKGSWYVGLAPRNDPRFVVVVALEDEGNLDTAEEIGRLVLDSALRDS